MRKFSTRDMPSMKEDNVWQWLRASKEISYVFKWRRTEGRGHQFQKELLKVAVGPQGLTSL